jgi:hypothetical protein
MLSLLRTGLQRDQQIYEEMKDKPLYTTPPAQPAPVQEPLTWLKTIETLGGFGKFVEAKPNEKGAKPVYLAQPAQPALVQEPVACKTLCELCVKRGYAFCANAAKTTPINLPEAQPAPVQSCYCPNCEAMGKELAALKAQPAPVQDVSETDFGNMTKDEALKLALEALTALLDEWTPARQAQLKGMEAVTAIKQALAAPVQDEDLYDLAVKADNGGQP